MLQHYGLEIGLFLVVAATAVAFAMIARASKGIANYRHENHIMLGARDGDGQ